LELGMLRQQAGDLERALENVRRRVAELEPQDTGK